ncbi:MAG: Transcription regulator [Candidatus Giovannonibacteria bacterium GW2011_GWA2_53_7]|uniref:Transcription regulator n=1 Tax=Candidatus Giovannonibacteria bacterium GW2011_GWA2_53_7 TaxID=1618650 RepID=A0A0G1Y232_9BACT|nr:MAG: Transcription regulator [Candidatus Giovannonibacteria bacterium GW2011_GWA2_53_7]
MSQLAQILIDAGLGEKEACVYLAACELGPSSAQDISKKSGVNRATVYVCLEALEKRGYLSVSSVLGKTVFIAGPPEGLLLAAKEEAEVARKKEEHLRDVLPQLAALYNVEGNKPEVLFMEGIEGLREHLSVMERLRGPYVQITNTDDAARAFTGKEFERADHQGRLRKGDVEGRSLLVTAKPFSQVKLAKLPVDVRLLHEEAFPIHGEITVREDTLLLLSFKLETFVTIIRSKTLANTFRALFELAWKGAEGYPGFTKEERMSWPETGRIV